MMKPEHQTIAKVLREIAHIFIEPPPTWVHEAATAIESQSAEVEQLNARAEKAEAENARLRAALEECRNAMIGHVKPKDHAWTLLNAALTKS